jgi:hypothetical protein
METASLIYHISVILMALVIFFMKVTARNDVFELLLKTLGKIVPLFCMLYAGIQIFKHFGIIA